MVSFLVRMRFDGGDHEAVRATLEALTAASRKEPGCVSYVPHFVEGDANTVVIYEQYKDESALEAHRQTPHFKEHAIGGLYQKMKDRAIENLTAVCELGLVTRDFQRIIEFFDAMERPGLPSG